MEVLKSGDELERQILDDARAKATRILAEADRECAAIREEWQHKTEADVHRLEADRDARTAAVRQEQEASLPLDLMRARLSYVQETVSSALEKYFATLSPDEIARVVGEQLRRIPPVLNGAAVVVSASGMSASVARRIVEESLPGVTVDDVKDSVQSASGEANEIGLVLETTDGRIRFRGTLVEIGSQLLERSREELVEALFGKDV